MIWQRISLHEFGRWRIWSDHQPSGLMQLVGSCQGVFLHAGVEAGPAAPLLPAPDGWHSLGLWGGVPEAAPGSSRHTGARLHPCLKLITLLLQCNGPPLIAWSSCHQHSMSLHSAEFATSESVRCPAEHSRVHCIRISVLLMGRWPYLAEGGGGRSQDGLQGICTGSQAGAGRAPPAAAAAAAAGGLEGGRRGRQVAGACS